MCRHNNNCSRHLFLRWLEIRTNWCATLRLFFIIVRSFNSHTRQLHVVLCLSTHWFRITLWLSFLPFYCSLLLFRCLVLLCCSMLALSLFSSFLFRPRHSDSSENRICRFCLFCLHAFCTMLGIRYTFKSLWLFCQIVSCSIYIYI